MKSLLSPIALDEEIDEIPAGSPSFVADGETYYYVDYNFYVQYEENGKSGYTNGEPEVGGPGNDLTEQALALGRIVTEIEEEGEGEKILERGLLDVHDLDPRAAQGSGQLGQDSRPVAAGDGKNQRLSRRSHGINQ